MAQRHRIVDLCLIFQSPENKVLAATKAAVEEGIIFGGGSAYIHASKKAAEKVADLEGDEKTGANIILKALEAPLFQIAVNAGLEGAVKKCCQEYQWGFC